MADLDDERKDMQPLFDCIVNNIPAPEGDPDADKIHRCLYLLLIIMNSLDVSV